MTGLSGQLSAADQAALSTGLIQAVKAQVPSTAGGDGAAYLRMVTAPTYPIPATAGFVDGFADGFLEGCTEWKRDLEALFRLVGVGVTVSLAEFFVRPIVEDDPQGLSPKVKAELEQLRAMQRMGSVFRWLDQVGPIEAAKALRDLIPDAEDIATMIGRASLEWWSEQVRTAPDAVASGRHLGRLIGRIALELIRAFCEPDSFALGEALEVSYEETEATP
ncbi:hypothetical protein Cme02nite_36330 [Catellatospora methionotrophica]|uniref:Uncharacterized protein n=1 Tax=Catellatospora methionotrophica TaxID=121620 RepID=A0A8J3PF50_9ACTN|nr:hypothetical protein [Catellatospora methionotrophica]GIG15301.1 hypothetical protein Cme02nite_36330 [Catellatospora methionotrophica]